MTVPQPAASDLYRGHEIEHSPREYEAAPYRVRTNGLRFPSLEAARAHVDRLVDAGGPRVRITAERGSKQAYSARTARTRANARLNKARS